MRRFNIPIDYKKIAEETGVRKGNIFNSGLTGDWVVSGHSEIDLIVIEPPHNIGDIVEGKTITFVKIVDNEWVFEYTCND